MRDEAAANGEAFVLGRISWADFLEQISLGLNPGARCGD
jgi:hypothetical protein